MPRSPRNVSTITPGRVTASAWTDTTTTKFPSPDFSLGAAAAHTLRFQDSPMIKSEDGIVDEEIKEEVMSDAEEMDSPLLKASQERGFINPGPLPPLNDKCSASSSRFASSSVRERGSTLYAFRQRPYRIQSEGKSDVVDSESNVNSSSPPIFDNDRHTFRLNPHREGKNEMGGMHNVSTKDTIVDAASILLSIGQCGKSRSSSVASGGTGGSCNRKAAFLEEAYEEKGDGNTFAASSNVATCYGRVNSAMKNDSSSALLLHTSQDIDATKRVRVFPPSVPILLEQFPRLYQRYRVPAVRGKRSLGVWNEPQDDLDLYTPRWVRGEGRDKEGLCIICLQHQPRVMRWKRIKTSEYNYHLINQHGISPNTQRPYDPPIAIRTRDISNPAAGHRQSVIQGKCHVCKKFVDMQGKYSRDVKVPEIYWWKHARQCHKGKARLIGTGGTFVEDERYQQICADIEAKPVSSAVQQ